MTRLKKYCEISFDKLSNYYSVASELQLHTGTTQLNLLTQAKGCASDFSTIFDQIKIIFPKTYAIFCQLPKPDIVAAENCANSIEDNLAILYKETNNLCTNGGDKFIIFLPSHCDIYDTSVYDTLTMIPCALVCDFGTNNGKDVSSSISDKAWTTKIHPIKSKDDFVVGSSMTNWYFCRGQENVGEQITYDFKNWKVNKSKQLLGVLTNVVKKNNTSHFYILNFINEPKYAPYIFEQLNTVFGDEVHTQNRCDFFSFATNRETTSGLEEWSEDSIVNHKILNILGAIPEEEYNYLEELLENTVEDIADYNSSFAGIVRSMSNKTDDLGTEITTILDAIKNREGIELLSEIKNITGTESN